MTVWVGGGLSLLSVQLWRARGARVCLLYDLFGCSLWHARTKGHVLNVSESKTLQLLSYRGLNCSFKIWCIKQALQPCLYSRLIRGDLVMLQPFISDILSDLRRICLRWFWFLSIELAVFLMLPQKVLQRTITENQFLTMLDLVRGGKARGWFWQMQKLIFLSFCIKKIPISCSLP